MRIDLIQMLEDTLEICRRREYEKNGKTVKLKLSRYEMCKSDVLLPDEVKNICDEFTEEMASGSCETKYSCTHEDSYSAAIRMKKEHPGEDVLVLNFANPVNIGGGVRRDARAQEEDLCRKSSLLVALEDSFAKKYYEYNRSLDTYLGSDAVILTPQVEIIKDYEGKLLDETVVVSVLTAAAPMLTFDNEGLTDEEVQELFSRRVERMLAVVAHYGYKNLVLGAWGCGAFGNDAAAVAPMFDRALRKQQFFKDVCFAVIGRSGEGYNYDCFAKYFDE